MCCFHGAKWTLSSEKWGLGSQASGLSGTVAGANLSVERFGGRSSKGTRLPLSSVRTLAVGTQPPGREEAPTSPCRRHPQRPWRAEAEAPGHQPREQKGGGRVSTGAGSRRASC